MFRLFFRRLSILTFLFLLVLDTGTAQKAESNPDLDNYFIVQEISLEGNNKTKEKIIFRELDFNVGDTIFTNTLTTRINENKKRLLSTGLFNLVNINIKDWKLEPRTARIQISFTENWYIWPAPIFELADRNFNVWWNDHNRSLSRVNYGARLTHINFTGQRDAFKAIVHFGYTRKFELRYHIPFINNDQTIGVAGNLFYSDAKEIGYMTIGNKTQFANNNDDILRTRFRASGSVTYRPNLNHYHRIHLAYHHNTIDKYVATNLNQEYFLNGETNLKFFVLEYQFRLDNRVFRFYPEGGSMFAFDLKKEGVGIFGIYNNMSAAVAFEKYYQPHPKFILGARIKAKTNLIRSQVAFANNTGLGYGRDFIRGYELYVIDGTDYVYTKASLKWNLFEKILNLEKGMPVHAFKKMLAQLFLSFNFDSGYVNERDYLETNTFNNRWLFGYGPGLDLILYNNYLFKIEYSWNHTGEGGLYLSNLINF